MKTTLLSLIITGIAVAACAPLPTPTPLPDTPAQQQVSTSEFILSSPAFAAGGSIPTKYGCTGQNISPPLTWSTPPAGTQSLALILYDPDAPGGDFVHWVIYHMPADKDNLAEAISPKSSLDDGSLQGQNGAASTGFIGPCPPSGTHHYVFTLYALDTGLDGLSPGPDRAQLLQAMQGHILAQAELIGTFTR